MMDFSQMKMTHKQIDNDLFRLRVGNDFMEVYTNYMDVRFPNDLKVVPIIHYIGTKSNRPTNPRRTAYLLSAVVDYFYKLILKQMEKDLREIAALPVSDSLQETFNGRRFFFYKGTSAHDVLSDIFIAYNGYNNTTFAFAKDLNDILEDLLKNEDGFLSDEIREYLTI